MKATIYVQQGMEFLRSGNLAEAAAAFTQAIHLDEQCPEGYYGLGFVQASTALWKKAEASLRQAISLKPDFPEAYNNLGSVLINQRCLKEAELCLRQAIHLNSQYPEAYGNLGVVFMGMKDLAKAETNLKRAIQLKADYVEAYINLGLLYKDTNQLAEAERCLRQAITLKADSPECYNNLGLVLRYRLCLEEAEACFRQAIKLRPDYSGAYINLGILLKDTYRLKEAEACFNQVIQQQPDCVEAGFALGVLYLLQGQYDKWWEKFELRRQVFGHWQPEIRQWQGEALTGQRILLYYELGFGDTIQFVRYAAKVAAMAATTTVWVQPPLQRLLQETSKAFTVYTEQELQPEKYDVACSLLSLPYYLQTTQETIPREIPYLQPSPAVSAKWRKILGEEGSMLRVGVVWAGNPNHKNDANRSINFAIFKELFAVKQVSWISLQVGPRAGDLVDAKGSVLDVSATLSDFCETAGVIDNLDLVIAVDTAVAHLAGAMGKRIWLLLSFASDWRWQLEREDSIWYPSMRIFRQQQAGNWAEVVARVKEALQHEKMERARLPSQ